MKTKLKSVVDERMKDVEQQIRADYEEALSQMSRTERQSPGARKRLAELVAIIESKRAEQKLQSLEKLVAILADASDDVKEALAELAVKNFERRQDRAYQRISERLDMLGYRLYGSKWVESTIADVVKEHYGQLKGKGNGKG